MRERGRFQPRRTADGFAAPSIATAGTTANSIESGRRGTRRERSAGAGRGPSGPEDHGPLQSRSREADDDSPPSIFER